MCLLKVANRQGSGDYAKFRPTSTTGATTSSATATATATSTVSATDVPIDPYNFHMQYAQQQQQPDYLLSAVVSPPVLPERGQFGEMSAMVTALTHVVSGQRHGGQAAQSFGVDSPTSAYSSSSSGSWAGQKRRRHHDDSVAEFSDRVYRGIGESSSSVKTGSSN